MTTQLTRQALDAAFGVAWRSKVGTDKPSGEEVLLADSMPPALERALADFVAPALLRFALADAGTPSIVEPQGGCVLPLDVRGLILAHLGLSSIAAARAAHRSWREGTSGPGFLHALVGPGLAGILLAPPTDDSWDVKAVGTALSRLSRDHAIRREADDRVGAIRLAIETRDALSGRRDAAKGRIAAARHVAGALPDLSALAAHCRAVGEALGGGAMHVDFELHSLANLQDVTCKFHPKYRLDDHAAATFPGAAPRFADHAAALRRLGGGREDAGSILSVVRVVPEKLRATGKASDARLAALFGLVAWEIREIEALEKRAGAAVRAAESLLLSKPELGGYVRYAGAGLDQRYVARKRARGLESLAGLCQLVTGGPGAGLAEARLARARPMPVQSAPAPAASRPRARSAPSDAFLARRALLSGRVGRPASPASAAPAAALTPASPKTVRTWSTTPLAATPPPLWTAAPETKLSAEDADEVRALFSRGKFVGMDHFLAAVKQGMPHFVGTDFANVGKRKASYYDPQR